GPHAARVRPARVSRAPSRPGALPRGAAAQGVGLRLRGRDAHRGRARPAAAGQAREPARVDRDGARSRLQAERAGGRPRGRVTLSARARLLFVPVVAVASTAALIIFLEHGAQRRWLIQRESDTLARIAREAARTAEPVAGSWQPAADSLDARFALRATVIAADGSVLADSRARAREMENHAGRPEVRAALSGRTGLAVRRSATVAQEFLYCAVPMRREGAAVMRLAEPLVVVGRLATSLTRLYIAAASLALLASVIVLLVVNAGFARRVLKLRAVARRIGLGGAGAPPPGSPAAAL